MLDKREQLVASFLCGLVVLWSSGLDREHRDVLWFLHVLLVFLLCFLVIPLLASVGNWLWRRFQGEANQRNNRS
ncbi:hypothetical protein EDD41_2047 [Luteococcus japonicus]|uniref:Uncharacterized protein n=1 Tax=Luteococcus japonicus TaxID=33984 RepID=A0A3N1ZVJ5_9ACTN|nr:hypothetical protein EDD41_2047 [Luteococcus japonicus]